MIIIIITIIFTIIIIRWTFSQPDCECQSQSWLGWGQEYSSHVYTIRQEKTLKHGFIFPLPFIWLISALGTRILLPYRVSGHSLAPIPQRKWARRLCLRVASPARGKCYNNPATLNKALLPLLTPGHNSFELKLLLTFFQNSRRSFATKRNIYPDEFSKKNTRWAKISQQC